MLESSLSVSLLSKIHIQMTKIAFDGVSRYGRDNAFRKMEDVQFVAAMGPPGGGRTFITNRYTRHFHTLALAQVSQPAACIRVTQVILLEPHLA